MEESNLAGQCNNESEESSEEQKKIECEEIKIPDEIAIPKLSHEEYEIYGKIQKGKKQKLDDDKQAALRTAEKTKEDTISEKELDREKARSVFNLASQQRRLDMKKEKARFIFEIQKYYDEYQQNLRNASNEIPSLKNCDDANDLPDYIKIIYITELHQKISDLKVDSLNKRNQIESTFKEACNVWNKAEIDYKNAVCEANASEQKQQRDADLAWRQSLKMEVDAACKA